MPSKINEYAYETGRIATAAVTTTTAEVLPADPNRRYAILCNTGATDCFLAIGVPAEAGKGILIKAGNSYEMCAQKLTHAAISAITASDTTNLSIQEGG